MGKTQNPKPLIRRSSATSLRVFNNNAICCMSIELTRIVGIFPFISQTT
jgi:hypothetical protein